MLRGTRENISSRALICNCAGVIALCFLLLASIVAIPLANLQGALLTPAYAQETEGEEGDEAETAELERNQTATLVTLQGIAELGQITDSEGLAEVAEATDSEELSELAGASDSE